MPTRFDLIQEEVNTDSYLKEWKDKVQEQIDRGEYPPNELTEDKIIEIIIKLMIERCNMYPIHDPNESDFEFFAKILLVMLYAQLGSQYAYRYEELICKLKEYQY